MTTPAVKLMFCMRRLPHLTREEFQAYWYDVHAPLVRACAQALGISKYIQSHARDDKFSNALQEKRGAPAAFDGVAELWFESREGRSEEWKAQARAANAQLLEDESRFIDLTASPMFFVDERDVLNKGRRDM
ncbi:hypothetical protein BH11PSE7_BH11PSE7_27260 [soil metagenome]